MSQLNSESVNLTVVDYVAESIKVGILEGRYALGQRLVEADLTAELGVSRGPLREALRRLAAYGIVEIQPYRGAVVRRLSRAELNDLFRVREILEGLAARTAAERIKMPGNRDRALALRREIEAAELIVDVMDHIEDNEKFHRTIFDLSGNYSLQRAIIPLQMPTYRLAFFRLFSENRRRSLVQHADILEAIIAGDPDRAEAEMCAHIRATEELSRKMSDTFFAHEKASRPGLSSVFG